MEHIVFVHDLFLGLVVKSELEAIETGHQAGTAKDAGRT
jgi:hypothetical protein